MYVTFWSARYVPREWTRGPQRHGAFLRHDDFVVCDYGSGLLSPQLVPNRGDRGASFGQVLGCSESSLQAQLKLSGVVRADAPSSLGERRRFLRSRANEGQSASEPVRPDLPISQCTGRR
jgi:hypothetical protein